MSFVISSEATDQGGNVYVFDYSNNYCVSNTAADPGTFTGRMTYHPLKAGNGPARLGNGFAATITSDFATFFNFEPLNSRGDPIDFANNGSAAAIRCSDVTCHRRT